MTNVSECSVAETFKKSNTLSYVVVEKISSNGGGGGGSVAGGTDEFVIATGFPDLQFCLLFA